MLVKSAVILAAGFGTRMENLTTDRPKPLLPVWGKSMLEHILTRLKAYDVQRVIINKHYLADQIYEHTIGWKDQFQDLIFLHEDTLLGSGGTLLNVLPIVGDDPFFVINGDVLWAERGGPSLGYLNALWDKHHKPVLALVDKAQAWGYRGPGDFFLDSENHIQQKPTQRAEAPYVFGGIQLWGPEHLRPLIPANPPIPLGVMVFWRKLIQKQALLGCVFPDPWYHVGDKAAYQEICHI